MKLSEHVDDIRDLTEKAFDKLFSQLGLGVKKARELEKLPTELHGKRTKIDQLIKSHTDEVGSYLAAREKALDELTFTLFNRIAALKVMESHRLFPEAITKRSEHGDRSFAHKAWLEENPSGRNEELEGIRTFLKYEFNRLGEEIGLYHRNYPYALLPGAVELNNVLDAFNAVEKDNAIDSAIWQSDDILGWLYESYNNPKKKAHKDSKAKTEYDKVSIQSQVYTPRWVVQFLVDNSLGKLYLEMYPDSEIKEKYTIANAPSSQVRDIKPLTEIKLIDPAMGSGNFLLYAFDLFYDLYMDQVENYGADYDEDEIPKLIIEHNLHGIDLDDRAAQLAQLGLYIKAKRKRLRSPIRQFNVVSSDFYLPDYTEVRAIFDNEEKPLSDDQKGLVQEIWGDLQQAYRFGSLVRIGEKLNQKLEGIKARSQPNKTGIVDIFAYQEVVDFEIFKADFFLALEKAIAMYAQDNGENFLSAKTQDAITYLKLLTIRYDVATANPPYTDSSDFGKELKNFISNNYKKPLKFHANLYSVFIKRCYELVDRKGKLALIHPLTFMFIKSYEDVRKFIIENTNISIFVDYGPDSTHLFDGAFASAPAFYILEKVRKINVPTLFLSLGQYTRTPKEKLKRKYVTSALKNFVEGVEDEHHYLINQEKLNIIQSSPFAYSISDSLREKFKYDSLEKVADVKVGINSGKNEKYVRFWWELNPKTISQNVGKDNNKWVGYSKGGPYNKWYGNLWLKVNWENNGKPLKDEPKSVLRNKDYFFKEGITYAPTGSKPIPFRHLPTNYICDVGGSAMYPLDKKSPSINYLLGLLNSKIAFYLAYCLNPTVNTQVGDLKRIPYTEPTIDIKFKIENLSKRNVFIKKTLCKHHLIEETFKYSPINLLIENQKNNLINTMEIVKISDT